VPLKSDYRPEIDGLRALAVISVIIDHFNKTLLPSGFLGVDIFFVISGYVISSSLYNNSAKYFGDFITGFYSRRLKRLVPALVLCVLTTSLLICFFDPNPWTSLRTGESALFGLSNLYLLRHSTDYFGVSAQFNAFTHTWSLGVEEQFYLLFPLIFWFTGFTRRHKKGLRNLIGVLGSLAVCSLVLFVRESRLQPSAAFFLMPARFWELSAGCIVFVALNKAPRFVIPLMKQVPSLVVLLLLVTALFVPAQYSVYTTIAVVLLTALLIASVRPATSGYKLLVQPAAMYIGRISYSLYLWHWPVLVISRWTVGIHWWLAPLQGGLMLFLAAMSYNYVETPLRRAKWSAVRWRSVLYGIGASACAAGLLLCLSKSFVSVLYTGKPVAEEKDQLTDTYSLPDRSSTWGGEPCVLTGNGQVGKVIPIEGCTLGNFSTAKHRILVVGNSFSSAFVPAFDKLVMTDEYSVTITSAWGASPIAEVPSHPPWDEASSYYWGELVPKLISQLRTDDSVFLVDDLAVYLPESASGAAGEAFYPQLRAGISRMSLQLSNRGIRLVVLDGLPFAREAGCGPSVGEKQWFAPFGPPCHFLSKEETLQRRAKLDQMLTDLSNQGKINVVDLMDIFCPGKMCTYDSANGQILYRDDESHPSVAAARLSAPIIREVLTSDGR
jgi:peptidoglycan/LPS O-acetylase OafA/YrhL